MNNDLQTGLSIAAVIIAIGFAVGLGGLPFMCI